MNAVLALSDGTVLEGAGFGAEASLCGELVFNTSLTGYEESLTDPSYRGQILVSTYPLIGNYGVRKGGFESDRVQVSGFCIRELSRGETHRSLATGLSSFLKMHGVPGISGIDTRFLTKKIRTAGVMNACITASANPIDAEECVRKARKHADISDLNFLDEVSTKEIKDFSAKSDITVGVLDLGVKTSIIRSLLARNVNVELFPYTTSPQEIADAKLCGLLVSNGPGDPKQVTQAIHIIKELSSSMPFAGICFGNQLISLALGGDTYKLKFGHRGVNRPVKALATNKVAITSQNHGFAVDEKSLEGTGLKVSHVNLNDNSIEGVRHENLPIIGFQAHPEANPGPSDCSAWFDDIIAMMKKSKR